jgi:mycofactocin system glycosyltransferase
VTSRPAQGQAAAPAARRQDRARPDPLPLPAGFAVEPDAGTKQLSDGTLFGGSPARAMRLTAAGQAALAELRDGPVRSAAAGVLARRMTDAGLAHPVPPPAAGPVTVTVVIPVRDRADMLSRCLSALGDDHPVVVVDDGSADGAAVAAVAARHGAELRRRPVSGGPAAARNTGLAGVQTDLVAFLDSDCRPPAGWIGKLAAHLADPLAAAVAPRIVTEGQVPGPAVCRYEQARGSLDLGARPGRVMPGSRVSYVPTAALVVRRSALTEVTAAGYVFDEALRYGEDVDLIWRLHAAGWRIRYEPAVRVAHDGPGTWAGLLARRFRYGTSAAPLASRHPGGLAPLVLQPWPAITTGALLAGRPAAAAAGLTAGWLELTGAVRRAGLPADGTAAASLTAVRQTWLGAGRYATQFAAPALACALAGGGGSGARRWRRRAAAASLLLGPALTTYAQQKPDLGPVRFALAHIADDVCYGAGVWAGCLAARTLVPLRPAISRRPLAPSEGNPS